MYFWEANTKLADLINQVKRECGNGQYQTVDQVVFDCLARINLCLTEIWEAYDWPWALTPISFPVNTQNTQYLVQALNGQGIDRITDLFPQDPTASPPIWGAPLGELERQDFYAWFAGVKPGVGGSNPAIPNTPDIPTKYVNLGLDPNGSGLWLIELAPVPSSSFNMKGFAKKILTQIVTPYLVQDYNNNVVIGNGYFPAGIIDYTLMDGVKSGIYENMGQKNLALSFDNSFKAKIKQLMGQQANSARDNSGFVQPPPDTYRFKRRMRSRGGTGVY